MLVIRNLDAPFLHCLCGANFRFSNRGNMKWHTQKRRGKIIIFKSINDIVIIITKRRIYRYHTPR